MGHDRSSYRDKVFSRVMGPKQVGELSSTKGQSTVVPEHTGSPRAAYLVVAGLGTVKALGYPL